MQAKAQQLARWAEDERRRHRSVDAVFEMAERDSEIAGGISRAGGFDLELDRQRREQPEPVVCAPDRRPRPDLGDEERAAGADRRPPAGLDRRADDCAEAEARSHADAARLLRRRVSGRECGTRAVAGTGRGRDRARTPSVCRSLAPRDGSATPPRRTVDGADSGAAVFALGLQVLHAVVVYVITPWAIAKQGTYGALGVAAALLVGLFLISRLVVVAAVVNATLWERRTRTA